MLQIGEEKIARILNVYYLEILLGILPPLIIGIVLYGLNIIGFMTTTGATTELPPMINYLPYGLTFVLASFVVKEARAGLVATLLIVHLVAFVHVLVFIMIPTWKLAFACVSQAIMCDGFYTFLHIVMFFVTIVLTVSGFTTLVSVVTLSQSISQYIRYSMTDYGTFRDVVGDSINTIDRPTSSEEDNKKKPTATSGPDEETAKESTTDKASKKRPKKATTVNDEWVPSNRRMPYPSPAQHRPSYYERSRPTKHD